MVIIIKERATLEQVEQMLQTLRIYIKVTVDIERGILAGGGEKHALCEAALLEDGSKQRDIWGADWTPFDQSIAYESIINIRRASKQSFNDNSKHSNSRTCKTNYSGANRWI